MPHPAEHGPANSPLTHDEADEMAQTMKALSSPARLCVLTELLGGHRNVEDLATAAGLSLSATSHHLRILRALRLVRARRHGRHVRYALHDSHVADLLAAIRHHQEHVHPPSAVELPVTTGTARA